MASGVLVIFIMAIGLCRNICDASTMANFTEDDLLAALSDYRKRERRFGAIRDEDDCWQLGLHKRC